MKTIQHIGLLLFIVALLLFTAMLGLGSYSLTKESVSIDNEYHQKAVLEAAGEANLLNKETSIFSFVSQYKKVLKSAASKLESQSIPEGVGEWDFKLGNWKISEYLTETVKQSAHGSVQDNPWLWMFLTFGLAVIGGLLFIIPKFAKVEGIKNDGIYHDPLTRGLSFSLRSFFYWVGILGIVVWGFLKMGDVLWPIITLVIGGIIYYLVVFKDKDFKSGVRSASPLNTGWLGIIAGIYLVGFYILLYWAPHYVNNWVTMVNPLSNILNGGEASQWFLYGFMYCVIVLVMGIRMMSKYQHNQYQIVRTCSVIFFQLGFAFLIPQFLSKLNLPSVDLKNIWPLDYSFFYDYNLDKLKKSSFGMFILCWGVGLIFIAVPLMTYFFGKRWYCSWVCGCGGLAETLGDPYRQLSDKSMRAWKFERYIIHGVLAFAVIMTILVILSYTMGLSNIGPFSVGGIRSWYGFLIGAGFSGVVGTGFYPLMGNRVWCRFGCPLAAYLGLVQKFKSKFRITTNGSQCISCGNCSTYCEMGIDVRSYAQKGQDIVRSSCVGCGVCASVCPRGVLRLENGPDVADRTVAERAIHISLDEVKVL